METQQAAGASGDTTEAQLQSCQERLAAAQQLAASWEGLQPDWGVALQPQQIIATAAATAFGGSLHAPAR